MKSFQLVLCGMALAVIIYNFAHAAMNKNVHSAIGWLGFILMFCMNMLWLMTT